MPRTAFTIEPRLGGLKLKKDYARDYPYRLIFVMEVSEERIATEMLGIV